MDPGIKSLERRRLNQGLWPDRCLGLATLSETLLELLDRSLEIVDAFRFMCYAASIEIGDYFQAQIVCASNPSSSQNGK